MSRKTTNTGKVAPNGTNGKSASPNLTKPTVLEALSEKDRLNLKAWLDDKRNSFKVVGLPISRKRKRDSDAQAFQVQDDLFEDRLSVQYEVRPRDKWEGLRKYKKFTVGSESIATGQCILVKCDESEDAKLDLQQQWKAKVLEVRALDSEHVYVRVAWLNRPEDLATGRKAYHGKNELIPTNQMDVIDAMAVNGTFDIVKWDDTDDNESAVGEDQFFWRQTFDYVDSKSFSKMRIICVDNAPQNPDEMIIQCSNEDCRKWLHMKCIAEKAVQAAAADAPAKKKKKGRPADPNISTTSAAVAKAVKGAMVVEVFVKDKTNEPGSNPATKTEIVITNADGEHQSKELCCLQCGKAIEDED